MINLDLLRENPDYVIKNVKSKDPFFDITELINLDKEIRKLKNDIDKLRNEKNNISKLGSKSLNEDLIKKSKELSNEIKIKEDKFDKINSKFKYLYLRCPNLIEDDVPIGDKDTNKIVYTYLKKPEFSFEIKNHLELGNKLQWLDFEAASKMSKSNFALYKNDGVKIVYSLMLLMLKNNIKHGYQPILPPYLVNYDALLAASNFPRFEEDVYHIDNENLYLTPTAEVNLTNIYKNTILSQDQLPIRMTSWTSCFRKEAGGYGFSERGLIRIHQFEKAELYTITTPEKAKEEQDKMIYCAENILKDLNLHYRISLLASRDCSFASSKTYDIEVWLPGQNCYKEVSSISNCTDFQSRRSAIRYKKNDNKTNLVYTLNGSSLALSRLMVALMETYQQEDGTIKLPEILSKKMEQIF